MPVAMRFARGGHRHRAFYKIVVAPSKAKRDGRHLEKVGTYDPLPSAGHKMVSLNVDRIKYWLSVGVQPSEPVAKLLGKAGILPPFPKRISTKSADDVAE
eukprot:m.30435 g.30435  ORF g.30435 m.30435 type:complete len:100 (+) comp4708_c0_seq2:95-394(+)